MPKKAKIPVKAQPIRVLGIDQSYTDTGLAVLIHGSLHECESIKRANMTHKEYRKFLTRDVIRLVHSYEIECIILEIARNRPSLHTQLLLYSLSVAIADCVPVPVYAIDTRSWHSHILGNGNAEKADSVRYVQGRFEAGITNHNIADAVCIALAPGYGVNLYSLE